MRYDVKISCFGHTFNVKGIEAINKEEAEAKALKTVKTSACVSSSAQSMPRPDMGAAEELFKQIFQR